MHRSGKTWCVSRMGNSILIHTEQLIRQVKMIKIDIFSKFKRTWHGKEGNNKEPSCVLNIREYYWVDSKNFVEYI